MDIKFSDETMCRICFMKQDTVFSLFHKQKGISPCEKLNKIGVKAGLNDTGPSCICCDCLTELETTVHFLEKCEKSNQILAEHLGDILRDSNALHFENRQVDGIQDECEDNVRQVLKNSEQLGVDEARCEECGSSRRCRHWTPPATHTCPKCQKVFNRKFNFKLHLKRHSRERSWSCARCGASAVSRWLAARHCAPRPRRPCPVPGCGKTYTTNTNLSVHLRGHNGERPFECNDCGKKFSSKNTLQNHIRIHTGALPYICPICGKQFRTNKLSEHMATHTDARYGCLKQGCSKRFASRAALQRHARAHASSGAANAHAPGGAANAHAPGGAANAHAPGGAANAHAPGGAANAHAPPGGEARAPAAHACALCSLRYHHKQSLNKHVRKQHAQLPVPAAAVAPNDVTTDIECDLE